MKRLQTMFASGDYRIVGNRELYFQNSMFLIFKMLGFYIKPEVVTSRGRVDVVMQTADYIYIFEIKLDPRKKFLIDVNFSLEERGLMSGNRVISMAFKDCHFKLWQSLRHNH